MAAAFEGIMYQPVKGIDSPDNGEPYLDGQSPRLSLHKELFHSSRTHNNQRGPKTPRALQPSIYLIITLVDLVLFTASVAVLLFSFCYVRSIETNANNRLVKLTSTYSPILDKLSIALTTRTTNGSFWPQNPPSIYQLPPSPEVDATWSRLSDTHGIALTAAEVQKLGRDLTELWPYPSSYHIPGHPPNHQYKTYMALPNVFHQIHCLDIFRKLAHPSYYGEFWTHTSKFPFQEHVGHCQYLLLQTITCHADLEVVTFNKVRGTPGPFPEFSVEQKCRDFDSILQWKENNQINVTDEEWKEILVTPEGIRELEPEGRTLPPA